MKRVACMLMSAVVVALNLGGTRTAAETKADEKAPIAWGQLSGNTGCVIFAEGKKTSGHFYGVVATTKTAGKLTVLETQNYTFAQKEVVETQESMDDLTRTAGQDHVKFIKIPEKHSQELLEQARQMCKAEAQ